jgi:hypothetical protein
MNLTWETENQLEEVWRSAGREKGYVPDDLPVEKWQFLSWLTDRKGLLLHGSGNAGLSVFEPRKPNDRSPDEFSKQSAVYAASDAIWAIFYAILDRSRPNLRFLNAALKFELEPGNLSSMLYFFSLTNEVLETRPWREGIVYVLPSNGFVQQAPYELNGRIVHEPHWACSSGVEPLAKVRVKPEDFPFLARVHGHDDDFIAEQSAKDPRGFPWLSK